jgi:hypothetical protein
LDPSWRLADVGKFQRYVILAINVFGSIIINVNVIPLKGYRVDKYASKGHHRSSNMDETERSPINDALIEKGQPTGKQPQPNTKNSQKSKKITTHHNPSTFLLQTTYFIIKLLENLFVTLALTYHYKIQDIISTSTYDFVSTSESEDERIFLSFPLKMGLTVGVGTLISWVSHVIYYRLHGHPWKSANGPTIKVEISEPAFKYEYYLFGKRYYHG